MNGNYWTLLDSNPLSGNDRYQQFGYSVSLSNDGQTLAVGSPMANNNQGYVKVYNLVNNEWTLPPINTLSGTEINQQFGYSVSLSSDGQTLAVGSPVANDAQGYVKVYKLVNNVWTLLPSDNTLSGTVSDQQFGHSVSLSSDGQTLAVGSPVANGGQGYVKVYKLVNNVWTLLPSDNTLSGTVSGQQFGYSVSLSSDGQTLAVGSPMANNNQGYVKVYKLVNNVWTLLPSDNTLSGTVGGQQFGYSVSLSSNGQTLAVGAPETNNYQGYVKVYKLVNNVWTLLDSNPLSGTVGGQQFGYSVSLSSNGQTLAVGAFMANGGQGYVKVYKLVNNVWTLLPSDNTLSGTASNQYFGQSVSLSSDGQTLAVGAPMANSYQGYVNLYNFLSQILQHNVSVNFQVEIDASGNLNIFGKEAPVVQNLIVAQRTLPVNALYDSSKRTSLIEFWEPSDNPDIIKVQLANTRNVDPSGSDLSGAYQVHSKLLAKGLEYVLCDAFDCSNASPFSTYTDKVEYTMQRDFGRVALGCFAHYLFGHVDATSAITNDVQFIQKMLSLSNDSTSVINGTAEERYNAYNNFSDISNNLVKNWNVTQTNNDANLARRLVSAIVNKGITMDGTLKVSEIINGTNTDLNSLANIVAQVVGQDASRLMNEDNSERTINVHVPLRFIAGDVIYVNIKLVKPTIQVGIGQKVENIADKYNTDENYTLKITLGDINNAL